MKKNNNCFDRSKQENYPVIQNKNERSSTYNYTVKKSETIAAEEGFAQRLNTLRMERNISAREMSLSLGQAAGYINNIENGRNLPSMSMFFEICEFFAVTPQEFFDYTGTRESVLIAEAMSHLSDDDQSLLLTLAKKLERGSR